MGGNHRVFLKPEILVVIIWVIAIFSRCWAWNPGPYMLGKCFTPELLLFSSTSFKGVKYILTLPVRKRKMWYIQSFLKWHFLPKLWAKSCRNHTKSVLRCLKSSQRWKGNEGQRDHPLYLMEYLVFYSYKYVVLHMLISFQYKIAWFVLLFYEKVTLWNTKICEIRTLTNEGNLEVLQSVMKYNLSWCSHVHLWGLEDLHNDGEWNILCTTF